MIITEKELKKEYGFKDSLPVQDAVIQQFLIVIQDLPRRGGLAQLIIKRAAPVLMLILFFACLVSGLYKGFHQTLLMFLAILVFGNPSDMGLFRHQVRFSQAQRALSPLHRRVHVEKYGS